MRIKRAKNVLNNAYFQLSLIFVVALVVRLFQLILIPPDSAFWPDSADYVQAAKNLVEYGVFSGSESLPVVPGSLRTPGYSFIIVPFLWLFGGQWLYPLLLVQTLIGASIAVGTYYLARLLIKVPSKKGPLLAGLIVALDPASIAYTFYVLTEVWATMFLLASVLLFIQWRATGGWSRLIASGLLLGWSALIRPIFVYLWIPWSLWMLVNGIMRVNLRNALRSTLIFMLAAWLLPGMWILRNWAQIGYAYVSDTQGGVLLHKGAGVLAIAEGISIAEARKRLDLELETEFATITPEDLNEGLRHELAFQKGLQIMRGYPLATLRMHAHGVLRMMFIPGTEEWLVIAGFLPREGALIFASLKQLGPMEFIRHLWHDSPFVVLVSWWGVIPILGFLYLLSIRGYLLAGTERTLLLFLLLYGIAASANPDSYPRLRVPWWPYIAAFAGIGAAASIDSILLRRRLATGP